MVFLLGDLGSSEPGMIVLAGPIGFSCWVRLAVSEPGMIVLAGPIGFSCWMTWAVSEPGVIALAGLMGSSCWVTWASFEHVSGRGVFEVLSGELLWVGCTWCCVWI